MKIKIGSRKSDLARIQAYAIGKALEKLPEVESVEFLFKSSLGDQNQDDPLWQMPEKGVFTQDLTHDLQSGEVDLVVHSWKDLPVEDREETLIAGCLPRADQRDLLLFRKDRWQKMLTEKTVRILSSSPRRERNLTQFLSWALPGGHTKIEFEVVRGNVQTRVRKLLESDNCDGLVVAKAALDRMLSATKEEFKESWETLRGALQSCLIMVLPLKENPTAAAQGALAIEIRRADTSLLEAVQKINCSETFKNVTKERLILKSYGGGCHQKIGVSCLSRGYGDIKSLRGETDSGETLDYWGTEQEQILSARSDQAFPLDMKSSRLSEDRDIDFDLSTIENAPALFVSKARALPETYETDTEQIIWVAGSRTWKKLAERGFWVTGSSEAMGEAENPRLENIKGPLQWLKLTHQEALEYSDSRALATYELTDNVIPEDLGDKTHYFWTSYSSFKRALEALPSIRDRHHSCGPGKTAELIEVELKRKPQIFLSYKEWRSEFK